MSSINPSFFHGDLCFHFPAPILSSYSSVIHLFVSVLCYLLCMWVMRNLFDTTTPTHTLPPDLWGKVWEMILSLAFHIVSEKCVSSQHGESFKKWCGGWDGVGLIDSLDSGCPKVNGEEMGAGSCSWVSHHETATGGKPSSRAGLFQWRGLLSTQHTWAMKSRPPIYAAWCRYFWSSFSLSECEQLHIDLISSSSLPLPLSFSSPSPPLIKATTSSWAPWLYQLQLWGNFSLYSFWPLCAFTLSWDL